MRDRTLAVVLTVIAVILIGFPGLAFLCFGLADFIIYYGFNYPYLNISPGWANFLGIMGLCIGFFLIVITIIAGFFLLRRKPEVPPVKPEQPLPPVSPEKPVTPPGSDEPLPPPI